MSARGSRALAITVLVRVTEDAAFASAALDAELTRARLDPRDAAFATELVYGTLRVLPALDRAITAYLHRPEQKLDARLRAALRIGAYQIAHMPRVPVHAAVDECVQAVADARGPRLASVANAVLRKLAAAQSERAPATRMVLPDWLDRALVEALGSERAEAVRASSAEAPATCVRVTGDASVEALMQALAAARPEAEIARGELAPRALLLRRAGDPRKLPGYEAGAFAVQEEGAQLVALALGAEPGEQVADVCAGHGGKTALLCELVGASGHVLAADLDERKLERMRRELSRLGIPAERVTSRSLDLTVGTGGLASHFDRVLVDAPCTGLGTLRRRPELLLRVQPTDALRLADLQLALVSNAARLVRPGGLLLCAVCSFTREEGSDLATRVEAALPGLRRAWQAPADLPGLAADADGIVRIGPWLTQHDHAAPDVYQLLCFRTSP